MKKILWLVVSCLMVISLLLASCAPKVTEEKEVVVTPPTEKEKEVTTPPTEEKEVVPTGPEMVKLSLKKLDGTVVEKMVEKPRYGGTITTSYYPDPASFDPSDGNSATGRLVTNFLYEKLQIGDYTRGPVGTNEYTFTHTMYIPMNLRIGHLAESWEQPDAQTVIWHIRKGIYFQNIPPVNGREMTAEDVVYSILRQKASPRVSPKFYGNVASAEAKDKYTVVVKLANPDWLYIETTGDGSVCPVYAREMVEKYGNLNLPASACGTGAWMLEDYIRGSVITYKKNPNYWVKDPFFPENTLPYADKAKILIIGDDSTQIAALRSGKIDILFTNLFWSNAEGLKKTNPEIRQLPFVTVAGVLGIGFRVDKEPFNDIRVRQAMLLAVNQDAVLNDLLQGNGEANNYPEMREWGEELWAPLDKMPAEPTLPGSKCGVRELFTYNPEKAKQLLAEAGYPNGFKTSILIYQAQVDAISMVAAYWKDIGVDVELHVKDRAVWLSQIQAIPRTYIEGVGAWTTAASGPVGVWSSEYIRLGSFNGGNINDPHIEQTYLAMNAEPDQAKRNKLCKDLSLYVLEQAYKLVGPHSYNYNFWQPWLKNCEGTAYLSFWGFGNSLAYYWVDRDLKEEMIGSR